MFGRHPRRCQCGECRRLHLDSDNADAQLVAQLARSIGNRRAFKDAVRYGYLQEYDPNLAVLWATLCERNPNLASELLRDL